MAAKDEGPTRAAVALIVAHLRDDTDAAAAVIAPYLASPCAALSLIAELATMVEGLLSRGRIADGEVRVHLADELQTVLRNHPPQD